VGGKKDYPSDIIICVMINGIGSRTINIFGFKLFNQKVSNAIRITIPRHKRFDGFNLSVEKCFDMLPKIWIRIPYLGNRGDFLLKSCLNKIQRFLSKPVKFITIYDTK
jgi:hypothetical protein